MRTNIKYAWLFIIMIITGSYVSIHAQTYEEYYWFVVPDAAREHDDWPAFFMITAGDRAAEVRFSIPSDPTFTPRTLSLAAGEAGKFEFLTAAEVDLIENSINNSNIVTKKGILIEATNPISAYYQLDGYKVGQKEIFTLKGEKALGSRFYTPFQDAYDVPTSNYSGTAFRQIHIVATKNNTTVRFKSPVELADGTSGTLAANQEYSKVLQRGESLLLRGKNNNTNPAGTYIWTDEQTPIAVTIYEDCVQSSSSLDPIGDQLVPISNVGTNYVVIKGYSFGATYDHVYLLATDNNTEVWENDILKGTINAGETMKFQIGFGETAPLHRYYRTSKPAYCLHQSAVANEVGGALVPSMYSIASKKITFYNSALSTRNALFLIYRENAKNSFKLKLSGQAEQSLSVNNIETGIDGWLYSKQDLSQIEGECTVSNDDGAFAMGYFSSPGGTALYGYLSAFGSFSFGADTIYHCGTSYTFDGGYAKSYDWWGPGVENYKEALLVATKSGKYGVTVNQDPAEISDEVYLKLQNFDGEYIFPSTALINEKLTFSVKINTEEWDEEKKIRPNVYNAKFDWTFEDGPSHSITGTSHDLIEIPDVAWTTEGRKKITVKITNLDANCETIIEKYVVIYNYPDNITDETCLITPEGTELFSIKEAAKFGNVHSMSTPLVANLRGKGPEIIVPRIQAENNPWSSNGFIIASVINNTSYDVILPKSGNNDLLFGTHGQSVAIADIDNDGICEIFIQCTDYKIYCFNFDTQNKLVFKTGFNTTPALDERYVLQLADLNNDGLPELIAGRYIFNARTGEEKLSFTLENDGKGYGNPHALSKAGTGYYFMPAIGDIDGDGYLEIVAGSSVYKFNPELTALTSVTKVTNSNATGFKGWYDGPTVLVDFNGNGKLDVCVIGHSITTGGKCETQFYVWDPRTQEIIGFAPYIPRKDDADDHGNATIPYVGDLDSNGLPDFAYATTNKDYGMVSYQYNPDSSNNISEGLRSPDFAETAGFTMFDFNQDGRADIVYRGAKSFNIININDQGIFQNLTPVSTAYSGTVAEYPIVADVDGDGQAEIILTRAEAAWDGNNAGGYVSVYKSADPSLPWAPARSVWNQWNYNAVYINEDMTVPQYPINPATIFPGEDGILGTADDKQPYNGMLMQQTILDKKGEMVFLTPNAQIDSPADIRFSYDMDTDKMTISGLKIKNIGSAPLNQPVKIAIYKDAVANGNAMMVYSYGTEGNFIPVGTTETVPAIEIGGFSSFLSLNTIIIKVNDNGQNKQDQPACEDCDPANSNAFNGIEFDAIASAEPYRNCIGGTAVFKSASLDAVSFQWIHPDGSTISSDATITKNDLKLTDAGVYIFKATGVNNVLDISYKLPFLSVAPQTMYWKQDATDQNWNNIDNWNYDNGTMITAIKAIPAPCTDVHIPGKVKLYPSLDAETTPIDIYGSPEVNNITFHFNSALAYQHKLTYNKAFVQYNFGNLTNGNADGNLSDPMNRDKWYLLAAPLKKMASGDFAMAGYPFSWQANHQVEVIAGSPAIVKANSYSSNSVDLQTGSYNAIALKMAQLTSGTGYSDHKYLEGLKGIIEIPYFENEEIAKYRPGHKYDKYTGSSTFYYYNTTTLQPIHSPVGTMKRGQEAYRFVYEDDNDQTKIISLSDGSNVPGYKIEVEAPDEANNMVLIGNPFLAPINTRNFFKVNENSLAAQSTYWIYDSSTETWVSMDYSDGNYINSFQSFIVKLNTKEQTLLFPLEGDYALTGPVLPVPDGIPTRSLTVLLSDLGGNGDKATLISGLDSDITGNVEKLVSSSENAVPEVFFVDHKEEKYNIMQLYNHEIDEIGIGVKASQTGTQLSLNFRNIQEFVFDNDIRQLVLVDKVTGKTQDLTTVSSYNFVHNGNPVDGQFVDTQRFALRLSETATENSQSIRIYYKDNAIHVEGMDINYLQIYNVAGTKLYELGKNEINYVPLKQGVYIVKAFDKDGKQTAARIMVP